MGFFLTLILWVAMFALSQLLMPEPEIEDARPATLDDFSFPTATEGRIIPLMWGTDRIKGPNVIWYGDLKTVPITEKVKVNLFSSKKFVVGHRYYIGFQIGICMGPATLKAIYVGDEKVWSGTQSTDGEISISSSSADLSGTFYFYTGSKTQAVNSYLNNHQSPCPAYRGMCYGVWQGGYVGESTTIKPWSFEVERIPTGLYAAKAKVNNADCNGMEIVYEIFTNTSWGYGYSSTEIDTTDWQTAATTLHSEGNGMSFVMAHQKNATDIIKEVEKQIDGHFRIDPATGKWKCVLIRDGYPTSGLKKATEDNINEVVEFSRGTWEGTINVVRLMFKRRANDYMEGYAQAHDSANMNIQNRRVPAQYTYIGLRDDTLANKLAWREIRAHSYPLAKCRLKVNREFWDSYIGEVILLTYEFEDFKTTDMPFRITKIDYGDLENPEILIDAVQDVFTWRAASFSDAAASSWTLPATNLIPFPSGDQTAFELPYAIQRRHDDTGEGQIWTAAVSPGRGEAGYEVKQRNGVTDPASGTFYSAGLVGGFTWDGEVDGAIDQDATTIDITTDANISEFQDAITANEAGEYLYNMFMIEDELVLCTGVTAITGGLRFTGCLRGVCDTAQAEHADNAKVWFLSTGGEVMDTKITNNYFVDLKLLPYDSVGNKVSESDPGLTEIQFQLDYRPRRPYPPTFMKWGGTDYPANVTITSDVVVTFNRRDHRILNEESQHSTDASTINGDFPSNNNTKYRLKLWESTTLKYTGAWNAGAASLTMTFEKILRYLDGLPSTLKMSLDTKHTYNAVDYEAQQEIFHSATVNSSSYDDDHWLGVHSPNTASPNSWTAPQTGTYGFTIGTSIAGDVEARINGGTWTQVIPSGNTTGNLTGVTASDTIEVQHKDTTSSDEVLLTIAAPSGTEDGFGILIFA